MHTDFDFLLGRWHVHHRRLDDRLVGCTTWSEFAGTCDARRSSAVAATSTTTPSSCRPVRTARRRSAPTTRPPTAGRSGGSTAAIPDRLDIPVVGSFVQGVGTFLAHDQLAGRPIQVRFRWTIDDPGRPRWEQAFSADGGATWETNWTMAFTRAE
jgi:hypothetical protein